MPSRSYLARYQGGEYKAVWDELLALGEGVRHPLYLVDATAVATETMRRVRHNIEILIPRLAEMGYRFVAPSDDYSRDLDSTLSRLAVNVGGQFSPVVELGAYVEQAKERLKSAMGPMAEKMAAFDAERKARVATTIATPPIDNPKVFSPPDRNTGKDLKKLEKLAGGPLPLSLRAFYEEVGSISLMGSHPVINSIEQGQGDPLVVSALGEMIEMIEAMGLEDEGNGIGLWLAPDDLHKANTSGGEPYTMYIPNAAADAPFQYEWHNTTFVNYLRIAFQWGGFPGWEHKSWVKHAPREIFAQLTEGLLPF